MSDSDEISESDSRDNKYGPFLHTSYHNPPPADDGQPYLEVVEQPQSRGFRFRYQCEGKSHGGLQGESSRREKKSYPTVRICHYRGPAKITVSLVTDEKEPKPHAHELIGKNCSNGTCTVAIKGDNMTVSFPNLGIRHVTKKSVTKILTDRLRETLKADKMMDGGLGQDADQIQLTSAEEVDILKQAEMRAKNMPLNVVRLSFRAYLQDVSSLCTRVLPAAISNPIYDSKAPCAALLKICRMDKVGGCCVGNEEVFLLCDKVQKDDIAIRFYEQDDEGNVKWEDYGNFAPHDVHRQYAIVFRTPSYMDTTIDRPVAVHVQLRRFTDGEVSDPKTFTYYPQQTDLADIQKKRKKQIPNFSDNDNFSATNNTGDLHMLQGSFGSFRELSKYNTYSSNGHAQSLAGLPGGTGHDFMFSPCKMPAVLTAGSRLEEDSAMCGTFSDGLVPRSWIPTEEQCVRKEIPGMMPASSNAEQQKTEQVDTTGQNTSQKDGCCVNENLSESDCVQKLTDDHGTQKVNNEVLLGRLLHCVAECTAQSVQYYAQTGDTRHLLSPARHLIQCKNDDGDNAVHLSVIHSNRFAVDNLLSVLSTLPNPVAINDCNTDSQSPLQLAVLTRQPQLVSMLLSRGANPVHAYDHRHGDTLLHIASRVGDSACLEPLLSYWVSNQTKNSSQWHPDINTLNYEGFCALHLAVRGGHLSCVKLLVTLGLADVNLVDGRSGRTALHHAVDADSLAVVGYLLLECSADVDLADDNGNTALHYAVAGGKLGIAALLVAANADPDVENFDVTVSESDESETDDDSDQLTGELGTSKTTEPVNNSGDDELTGKSPRDLAAGNHKMLRILNGEQYLAVSEKLSTLQLSDEIPQHVNVGHTAGARLKSFCDSGIASINVCEPERLPSSETAADLHKMDAVVRAKLSKLLDIDQSGSDWRELATRLGLGSLILLFEVNKSPTSALLNHVELAGGCMLELRNCLLEMKRKDAVKLIDEASLQTHLPQSA